MRLTQQMNVAACTLAASVFFVLACNLRFWKTFVDATGGFQFRNLPLYLASFLILVLVLNTLLTLVAFRPVLKPFLIFLFIATSLAAYFMNQYGVSIDAAMMQNVFETDVREAAELGNWNLVVTVLLLGLLPSVFVWRVRLDAPPLIRNLLAKSSIVAVSLVVAAGTLVVNYKTYAPAFREHGELRYLVAPANYLYATIRYLSKKRRPPVVAAIGTDAIKGPAWAGRTRRSITVIVVGETARAMNFSLNGYERETNPLLSRQRGLINFSDVSSCGTATAVSVPCVFSVLGRQNYSEGRAKSQQGLLDVLSHAGFDVMWRDNNSGCKGVCDRVRFEDVSVPAAGNPFCNQEECYDERLLDNLPKIIREARNDLVIVLHQKGSHGPAYWKRYPEKFGKWAPACRTSNLEKCPTRDIVAAYDNTILYTDYFLSKTIDILRDSSAKAGVDTAFLYFSDHGESLGERNLYLHGAPYIISPIEQRHVPLMLWLSDGFLSRFHVDEKCLAARAGQPFSHDHVFHSVLGMLNVSTAVYNPALDIFQACSRTERPRAGRIDRVLAARAENGT
jgi:lipid A ethanolaminephosphotransferase